MKTVLLSPQSLKPITMEDNRSEYPEEKENNYFHGCRKDANCNCNMCLDSISATLDLMPMSVQRSSLTKLSASKPEVDLTPVSIDPTPLSTPISKTPPISEVRSSKSVVRSTAKTVQSEIVEPKMRKLGFGWKYLRWVLLLGFILGLEFGFSWGIIPVLRSRLSGEILRDLVDESSGIENLSERLISIQYNLNNSVDGKVSSCVLGDSTWEINQDGLILISYCKLYKSAAEEVLIWGWPLQTAGLLTAGFSSRSFKVLSGRITEWPEGKIIYDIREANATWILRKWSASVVQFEPNTWIIEYNRNSFLEHPSILMGAIEFTKFRVMKLMQIMKQLICLWISDFRIYTASKVEASSLSIPT